MSKATHCKSNEVKGFDDLVCWLEAGCTPKSQLLMGVEHEKFLFDQKTLEPPAYEGASGIKAFLKGLATDFGWIPGYEKGKLIELERDNASWSIEPGGQVESGSAPMKNLHQIADDISRSLREAQEVANPMGLDVIGFGFHPVHSGAEMPIMPKSRYREILGYVEANHLKPPLDMMYSTGSIQVSLGYESEDDMVKKLRVGLALQPIVTALFANSPLKDGKPSGYQSYRSHALHNELGGRYGSMLPEAFEEGFGFKKFAEFAAKLPLVGIYVDEEFHQLQKGETFETFMEGKLAHFPGRKPTLDDWANHLNTIWPEVRVRHCLEMRGADCGPEEMLKALPAFWVGILYDKESLDKASDMIASWTAEDREYLRATVPRDGLSTPFMGTTVQEIAKNCLALSQSGLVRRAVKDDTGQDESAYLAPLHEIAQSGRSLATRVLEEYVDDQKHCDLKRLFNERSYSAEPSVLKGVLHPVNDNSVVMARQKHLSPGLKGQK